LVLAPILKESRARLISDLLNLGKTHNYSNLALQMIQMNSLCGEVQ